MHDVTALKADSKFRTEFSFLFGLFVELKETFVSVRWYTRNGHGTETL